MKDFLAVLFLAAATALASRAASIVIDVANPGPAFAPTMYGLFFEEINHAGDADSMRR